MARRSDSHLPPPSTHIDVGRIAFRPNVLSPDFMTHGTTFEAFGQVVTLDNAWRYARISGSLGFVRDAARSLAVRAAASELGLSSVDDAALQSAADAFRLERGLLTKSALRAWLAERWMEDDDFEAYVELLVVEARVRRAVVGDAVDAYFAAHRDALEEIEISRIRTAEASTAAELELMYLDGETSFHALAARYSDDEPYARRGGYVGFVPMHELPLEIRADARTSRRGDLLPLAQEGDGRWLLVRCESYRAPALDERMRERVETLLFQRWLDERPRATSPTAAR